MSSADVTERIVRSLARLAERVRHLETLELVPHTHTHASTTGQTTDDHHAKSHSHTVADGSGAIVSDQDISTSANLSVASCLATLISEANDTQRKITVTWSGSATSSGGGGAYIIAMGYRATATSIPTDSGYGVGLLTLAKAYNGAWTVNFVMLASTGNGTITMTTTTNSSTALDLSFQQTPPQGHYGGAYNVIQVGRARIVPTIGIANA